MPGAQAPSSLGVTYKKWEENHSTECNKIFKENPVTNPREQFSPFRQLYRPTPTTVNILNETARKKAVKK